MQKESHGWRIAPHLHGEVLACLCLPDACSFLESCRHVGRLHRISICVVTPSGETPLTCPRSISVLEFSSAVLRLLGPRAQVQIASSGGMAMNQWVETHLVSSEDATISRSFGAALTVVKICNATETARCLKVCVADENGHGEVVDRLLKRKRVSGKCHPEIIQVPWCVFECKDYFGRQTSSPPMQRVCGLLLLPVNRELVFCRTCHLLSTTLGAELNLWQMGDDGWLCFHCFGETDVFCCGRCEAAIFSEELQNTNCRLQYDSDASDSQSVWCADCSVRFIGNFTGG